ncbi:hypothetical protein Tco_1291965 [Tanacetum coccineum]
MRKRWIEVFLPALGKTDPGYHAIPLYSRFKQVAYKGVPHPLSGDYTPREQEDIDDSLYEYGKYGPQPQTPSPTVSNASSISFSICPSNDSDGELEFDVSSPLHNSTCSIHDSDGELGTVTDLSVNDDSIPVPSSEQDCDYYEKKMVKEAALKSKRTLFTDTTYKSNIHAVKGKMGTAVKTSAGCVWRKTTPHSNTNSGPTPDSYVHDHPLKHMEHRGIFDSGCSGHMTGNRAHLEDYQELSKVGSVTFGGSKGSISGKGTIRLGNLVFDDVAFVKELGHFNLFSISQICDKKLNVLFTEKECFVVSSDFKMPDENQGLGHRWMFDLDYLTDSMNYIPVSLQNQANHAGSKEVIDIDVQPEEAEELLVVSSTSRPAAGSEHNATKKSLSSQKPSSTPISKSADDIMVFRKELDALALKHLGPVPTSVPTSTNPVNTGSSNLNTAFEEVNTAIWKLVSPSAQNEEEVFSMKTMKMRCLK